MILGVAGTLGAGKGTVVEMLKKHGFTHYSSSGHLHQMLTEHNLEHTRKNSSTLANELMQKYEGGILSLTHALATEHGDENYILESLHRTSEAAYIKKIGGIILGVDADIQVRYDRITKRQEGEKDRVSFEQFAADAKREEEGSGGDGPHIRAVLRMADYTIQNNGTLEELQKQVDTFLATYGQ